MARNIDYDVRRGTSFDVIPESLETLQQQGSAAHRAATVDVDGYGDSDSDSDYEDLSRDIVDEDLVVAVLPLQRDEFRCQRCFLITHSSRMANWQVCRDCA
jgi:hypothetical protein